MKESLVRGRSYAFALGVVKLYRELTSRREFVLSRQMVRAGTSIGANIEEALAVQSRRDFAAKMSIASKEARECNYWLRLLRDSELAPVEAVQPLIDESEALIRMLTSIVKSVRDRPVP